MTLPGAPVWCLFIAVLWLVWGEQFASASDEFTQRLSVCSCELLPPEWLCHPLSPPTLCRTKPVYFAYFLVEIAYFPSLLPWARTAALIYLLWLKKSCPPLFLSMLVMALPPLLPKRFLVHFPSQLHQTHSSGALSVANYDEARFVT